MAVLLDAGANVNQTTNYGWTPLLTATQNRNYKLASLLLDRGANPNLKNNGGWSPLYIATDNRNIEIGDYPTPKSDIDHLEYIKLLLSKGADPNIRVCGTRSNPAAADPSQQCVGDSTETRTNFTMQWLFEDGSTPFIRAAQSSDVDLMKVLLAAGADAKLRTAHDVTALNVAAGIAWVEGVTFEWSRAKNVEAVKMLIDLGINVNQADDEARTALHGAAHKGRNEVIQMLVDAGANLEARDLGSRDTVNGAMLGLTWIPLHYAQGLVRWAQSPSRIPRPPPYQGTDGQTGPGPGFPRHYLTICLPRASTVANSRAHPSKRKELRHRPTLSVVLRKLRP
jgi:ankyrin repeat protein